MNQILTRWLIQLLLTPKGNIYWTSINQVLTRRYLPGTYPAFVQ